MSPPEAGLSTVKAASKCESMSCLHNCIGSAEISPHHAATGLAGNDTKASLGGLVYIARFRSEWNGRRQEFSGLHPLRAPDSTTRWAQLTPPQHLHSNPQRKHRKAPSLCLQPSAGGRCRRSKVTYEPATAPTCFRMGMGPTLEPSGLSYFERPEHLRTNRTKNKTPNVPKKLNCIKVLKKAEGRYEGRLL